MARRAKIYYKGEQLTVVDFDEIKILDGKTLLYDNNSIKAVIPKSQLLIITQIPTPKIPE
jgi:hypothetical protein